MRIGTVLLVGAGCVAAWGKGALAGGLLVGDSGSQGMQRAGAFVAKADDPSAILYNPAGLAKVTRHELYVGSNFLWFSQEYTRAGQYPTPKDGEALPYTGQAYPTVKNGTGVQPVPFLAASHRWKRLSIAEGIMAPQGYPGRDYPDQVTTANGSQAPAPGRYDLLEQSALMAFPSLALAYSVRDDLDIGARVSWGFADIKARTFLWGIKNESEDVGNDADFRLEAKDGFVPSYALGLLYRPTASLEIGATYTGSVHVAAKGTGTAILGEKLPPSLDGQPDFINPETGVPPACAPGGTRERFRACIDLGLPQVATVGARWIFRDGRGRERGDIELDLRWEDWSSESDIVVTVDGKDNASGFVLEKSIVRHGFKDVFAARLGGSYRPSVGSHAIEVRGGISHDTAAAPESWTRLDLDGAARQIVSAGIAYELSSMRIDLGGAFVREPGRSFENTALEDTGRLYRVQPDPQQPLQDPNTGQEYDPHNAGAYSSGYVVASVGVTAWW